MEAGASCGALAIVQVRDDCDFHQGVNVEVVRNG